MKYNGRTACAESHLLQVIRSRKTWLGVSLSDVLDYVAWAHENTTCTGSDMPPFCWIPVRYPRPLITMSEHTRICTDRTYMDTYNMNSQAGDVSRICTDRTYIDTYNMNSSQAGDVSRIRTDRTYIDTYNMNSQAGDKTMPDLKGAYPIMLQRLMAVKPGTGWVCTRAQSPQPSVSSPAGHGSGVSGRYLKQWRCEPP